MVTKPLPVWFLALSKFEHETALPDYLDLIGSAFLSFWLGNRN